MRCDACPVPEGLRCYEDPGLCLRAAGPGEGVFRAQLVRHAERRRERRAAKPRVPLGTRHPRPGGD
jgi:hypothetical protein